MAEDSSRPAQPVRPPPTFGRKVHKHGQVFSDMSGAMLKALLDDTLDPAYAEAAERKKAVAGAERTEQPRRRWLRRRETTLVVVGLVLAGLLVGIAYQNAARQAPSERLARNELTAKVVDQQAYVGKLQSQSETLAASVNAARDKLLTESAAGSQLLESLNALETASAQSKVTGPGVVITVSDPKPAEGNDPVGGKTQAPAINTLITDRDLQRVVNALWEGGAEAIAVNGQRLGPTTAIRQAGGAVLVDFLPVASPYKVEAIGPDNKMQTTFASSEVGRRLSTYRSVYQAGLSIDTSDKLTLKPALPPTAQVATPIGKGAK
ncbi:uncharacterized protein YlxW (UPF0749 family) [Antricoccus suffuscus]|uniref:Uncharacterized protein YlxW (UPF0749 family) n=1 Tax=Antricoccus suffuscus TaxID=1629062 RepID=A0A2T0ZWS6_9ACTN|nr:DUF881 domain-containing protein [Antricoccus suffuscus]PRZ40815.1 uncharacterized protein YlxW (UPF0749 family) [Antricoccus suffuscus]